MKIDIDDYELKELKFSYFDLVIKYLTSRPKYTKKVKYMFYLYLGLTTVGTPLEWIKSYYRDKLGGSKYNIYCSSRWLYIECLKTIKIFKRLKPVSKNIRLEYCQKLISDSGLCMMDLENDWFKSDQYNYLKDINSGGFIIYDSSIDISSDKLLKLLNIKDFVINKLKNSGNELSTNVPSFSMYYKEKPIIMSYNLFFKRTKQNATSK